MRKIPLAIFEHLMRFWTQHEPITGRCTISAAYHNDQRTAHLESFHTEVDSRTGSAQGERIEVYISTPRGGKQEPSASTTAFGATAMIGRLSSVIAAAAIRRRATGRAIERRPKN